MEDLFSNIHYKFIDHFEEIAINFGGSPREHFLFPHRLWLVLQTFFISAEIGPNC
jgi:hypothetical protein